MQVDTSITELDHRVSGLLKHLSRQAWYAAQRAPVVARELVSELQQVGLVDTASNIAKSAYVEYEPMAKELYAKYEPVFEQYAITSWRTLNGLPLFSQAAHVMVPTAAYWAEKYNQTVTYAAERGYAASYYLPLVPIERIAKTFGAENELTVSANGVGLS